MVSFTLDIQAIVVQRVDDAPPDPERTNELHGLVRANGGKVVETIVQEREEDPEYMIGSGKVETIANQISGTDINLVLFDGRLSPYQTYNIACKLPTGVVVWDYFQAICGALEYRSDSHREQLQTGLLKHRYDLPRISAKKELSNRAHKPVTLGLDKYTSDYDRVVRDRIRDLSTELAQLDEQIRKRRENQRDSGMTHAVLAGYTNTGRSALFNGLTDPDTPQNVTDEPFTTFDSLTRRIPDEATDILLTDTLGVMRDMPRWMHESLAVSYTPADTADLVCLCVSLDNPASTVREQLLTAQNTLEGITTSSPHTQVVFTHADTQSEENIDRILAGVESLTNDPVVVDATTDAGQEAVLEALKSYTPPQRKETFQVPLNDSGMALISWLHDNASVEDETYGDDAATVTFTAGRKTIGRARSQLEAASEERQNITGTAASESAQD